MSERDELVAQLRGWDHCWPAPWLEGAVQDAADQIVRDGREIQRLRDASEYVAGAAHHKNAPNQCTGSLHDGAMDFNIISNQ